MDARIKPAHDEWKTWVSVSGSSQRIRRQAEPELAVVLIGRVAHHLVQTGGVEVAQQPAEHVRVMQAGVAAKMIRQLHNILQNSFYKALKEKYPLHDVKMEYENRVDILRDSGNERWFYEIKPFENIIACLRQATGQLIEYAYRFQDPDKKINLVIVGPGALNVEARSFLDHFTEVVNLPLKYEQHVAPNRQDKI